MGFLLLSQFYFWGHWYFKRLSAQGYIANELMRSISILIANEKQTLDWTLKLKHSSYNPGNSGIVISFQKYSQYLLNLLASLLTFLTVSCLGDSVHSSWSPSPKYLLILRFGAQNSLATWLCSLSFPNHPSLLEQWLCISNKKDESQTGGHKWVCSYTPLVGHTLSNVRILIQDGHRDLLPRTWPL